MKKLVIGAMLGALVLSFAACGTKTATETPSVEPQVVAPAVTETVEAVSETASEAASEVVEAPVETPDYSGTYSEPMSGRCRIDIVSTGENTYSVNINWSASAFESANWEMNATYYESTGLLEYEGAKYFIRTYTDEENYTDEVKYTDGAGEFWFDENGMLGWRSANSDVDDITGETFFEKIDIVDVE